MSARLPRLLLLVSLAVPTVPSTEGRPHRGPAAAGNYWSDELHNPEHRIERIGVVLRSVRRT